MTNPDKQLLHAAMDGNLAEVEQLINNGADVDVADGDGDTPLHVATLYDYTEIIELLKQHGGENDQIE